MAGKELIYAVRFKVIGRYLGQILLVLALLIIIPLLFSLFSGDHEFTLKSAAVAAVTGITGWLFSRSRTDEAVQHNEALVLVALAFILAPLSMIYPMMSTGLSFTDAFFESVSGVTTTGLSVAQPLSDRTDIFFFSRAWMQWYGGLGIVTFSLAFIILPGINARRLSFAEGNDGLKNIVGGTRAHAKRVLIIYLTLSGIAFLLLTVTGTSLFSSLIHTMTSVSTGGFSTTSQNLAGLHNIPAVIISLFMSIAGAISFGLYFRAARKRKPAILFSSPEFRILLLFIVISSLILIFIFRFHAHRNWEDALAHGWALGVSAQTTTGYSTLPVSGIPAAAKLVLIFSMLLGANLGSTAGGIKLVRFMVIWKVVLAAVRRRSMPPHSVYRPQFQDKNISDDEINEAFLIFTLFIFFNALSWLIFLLAGQPPLNSLFDIISATGTVGLSTGVVDAGLPGGLKLLLCGNMLLGRLEMIALLLFIYPRTWFGKKRRSR